MENSAAFSFKYPLKILLAECGRDICSSVLEMLCMLGYRPEVAADSSEVLTMANNTSFDVILMDIMLPAVDGTTAIRRLKSDPETADAPIVAMSAGRTLRNQSEELADADAALAKPFDIDALLAQVAFHLSRRKSEAGEELADA